jgi:hypothetical protein
MIILNMTDKNENIGVGSYVMHRLSQTSAFHHCILYQ